LLKTLGEAAEIDKPGNERSSDPLDLPSVALIGPDKSINEAAKQMENLPVVLVVQKEQPQQLLGILTAYDLL
jgi:CBS domain-containing protein